MMRSTAALFAGRRAVVVAGARTPFAKSFGELMKVDTIGLSVAAVGGLIQKTKLDVKKIDHLIWGNVVMQTNAPNCAREIIIDLNLPKHIAAHSTSMACASGLAAISQGLMMIEGGHADVVIAGGSDSISHSELPLPRPLAYGLAQFTYGKKKGLAAIPNFFGEAGYNPLRWMPQPPAIAERSTGKTMGWHGDMISELYQISRADQEALAIRSHKNASEATKKGYLAEEIVPVEIMKKKKLVKYETDNLIRADWDKMEAKLPTLKPAFRKPMGTITAGTSSALTDGASAVLLMSEDKAKELGYPTDTSIKAWDFSGIDPYPELLLAPVLGWHRALKKANLTVKDLDVIEIHEAFAGQVLATIKCLESEEFAKKHLGIDKPVADVKIDLNKVNVNGSSIAIGHPFAATAGRVVTSAMNQLRRTGQRHAICSICAAGGLGGVCIVEHTPKK